MYLDAVLHTGSFFSSGQLTSRQETDSSAHSDERSQHHVSSNSRFELHNTKALVVFGNNAATGFVHIFFFFFGGGRSDLSLSATFHWPFSRDGQFVAIISFANDLSLVFSLILLLCSLPVGLLFHKLDPSSKLCCALSWIFDFPWCTFFLSMAIVDGQFS